MAFNGSGFKYTVNPSDVTTVSAKNVGDMVQYDVQDGNGPQPWLLVNAGLLAFNLAYNSSIAASVSSHTFVGTELITGIIGISLYLV